MNKELVRFKYKKDIVKCIEESWDYFGKEDEQRKVIKELENVYKIASSAKNAPKTEYEAKAKAFDSLKNKLENEVKILSSHVSGFPYVDAPIDNSISHFERVLEMMRKLEGGGSDD